MVQERVPPPAGTDRVPAVRQGRDAAELCLLHAFDSEVLNRALDLIATTDSIRGRDTVHAATAMRHGLTSVVSPDPAFDQVPGLVRIDPAALADSLR